MNSIGILSSVITTEIFKLFLSSFFVRLLLFNENSFAYDDTNTQFYLSFVVISILFVFFSGSLTLPRSLRFVYPSADEPPWTGLNLNRFTIRWLICCILPCARITNNSNVLFQFRSVQSVPSSCIGVEMYHFWQAKWICCTFFSVFTLIIWHTQPTNIPCRSWIFFSLWSRCCLLHFYGASVSFHLLS